MSQLQNVVVKYICVLHGSVFSRFLVFHFFLFLYNNRIVRSTSCRRTCVRKKNDEYKCYECVPSAGRRTSGSTSAITTPTTRRRRRSSRAPQAIIGDGKRLLDHIDPPLVLPEAALAKGPLTRAKRTETTIVDAQRGVLQLVGNDRSPGDFDPVLNLSPVERLERERCIGLATTPVRLGGGKFQQRLAAYRALRLPSFQRVDHGSDTDYLTSVPAYQLVAEVKQLHEQPPGASLFRHATHDPAETFTMIDILEYLDNFKL